MFKLTRNTVVSRSPLGKVHAIEHIREPFVGRRVDSTSPAQLADEYVAEVASVYGFDQGSIGDLGAPIPGVPTGDGTRLHRVQQKEVAGSIVMEYRQSSRGLPVWTAGFAVHLASDPLQVTGSTSSLHDDPTPVNDPAAVAAASDAVLGTPQALSALLHLGPNLPVSKINGRRVLVYQYRPEERLELPEAGPGNVSFEAAPPMPTLGAVPATFVAGNHYAVVEVLFDLSPPGFHDLHWRALVDPITKTVLYLRALIAYATAMVFPLDPISQSGNATLTPSAPEASLAPYRRMLPLTDLAAASPQPLRGSQNEISEIESPANAAPTTTAPFEFHYNVKTTDFSATNAYYHVNWFFNLIKGMGFPLASYFDHTTFPVRVDHWALGGSSTVNAHCPGNTTGNGIGHFCFAAAESGQNVGIADDVRVVIHEFGHALLWDHVSSPNFGFAHSAGDALGAILMDPQSNAPDRFLTFPWPQVGGAPLNRRHDRQVSAGWGWFGSMYNTQYNGEQVLSTTLFRLYRSVGGDSPHIGDRQWAARYVSYLIIKAIGLLTTTTSDPRVFVDQLMHADRTTADFEGQPGGALHKVIRWAFEKQGLYQPNAVPGTPNPVTTAGNPPEVDVYIDDGRHGEYNYLYSFWESPDVWVRRAADGGTTHQEPVVGRVNYMYVRVRNRGSLTAEGVSVKAYHCNPGAGLAWPAHWSPADTPMLAGAPIPPGGSIVVGPFPWTPTTVGHECLLAIASADGDPANDTTVMSSIPHSRFVPFDNNIGQRNVHPVRVAELKKLPEYLKKLRFRVVNPFPYKVQVTMPVHLPRVLRDAGYWGFFTNEGAHKFELAPNESRTVELSVVTDPQIPRRHPWKPLEQPKPWLRSPEDMLDEVGLNRLEDLLTSKRPLKFCVMVLMNGQSMGGMTYELRRGKATPGVLEPIGRTPLHRIVDAVSGQPGVTGTRIRRVTLDVDIDDGGGDGGGGDDDDNE
jgi:zinc metalloprotease ZmpB